MPEIEYESAKQLIDNWTISVSNDRKAKAETEEERRQVDNRTITERNALLKRLGRKSKKPIKI